LTLQFDPSRPPLLGCHPALQLAARRQRRVRKLRLRQVHAVPRAALNIQRAGRRAVRSHLDRWPATLRPDPDVREARRAKYIGVRPCERIETKPAPHCPGGECALWVAAVTGEADGLDQWQIKQQWLLLVAMACLCGHVCSTHKVIVARQAIGCRSVITAKRVHNTVHRRGGQVSSQAGRQSIRMASVCRVRTHRSSTQRVHFAVRSGRPASENSQGAKISGSLPAQ
jgi:hypothetical protein